MQFHIVPPFLDVDTRTKTINSGSDDSLLHNSSIPLAEKKLCFLDNVRDDIHNQKHVLNILPQMLRIVTKTDGD